MAGDGQPGRAGADQDVEITLAGFPDFGALERDWRELEARADRFSFFQSWTWLGCLAGERFPDPVLVRAARHGRTLGLALFNRRGATLHLAESGEAERDAIYVEHNGPLIAAEAPPGLAGRMLTAAWGLTGARRMVLSGTAPDLAAAAAGVVLSQRRQTAPCADLSEISASGTDFLESRSRNTRAQIRRSLRHFAVLGGPVRLMRPRGPEEARAWLGELIALHAADWNRRGKPGAFAGGFMRRFHDALAPRALARGELDLLRILAGSETLGFLYNFRHRGIVYAYQSGFRRFAEDADARPGFVGHALAIEEARREGVLRYDFLAGDALYKRRLATGEVLLAWTVLARPGLAGRLEAGARRLASGLRARLAGRR